MHRHGGVPPRRRPQHSDSPAASGHQGQGQGLYSMLWGVGVAAGSWLTGMVWDRHEAWAFFGAAVACGVAALLLLRTDLGPKEATT